MAEHTESSSHDPITPKAEQRVLEGEVSESSKNEADRHQNENTSKSPASDKTPRKHGWLKWVALILLVIVVALGYDSWQQTQQQNRQIERINQLQSQVQQLQNDTQSLKANQSQVQSELEQALNAQQQKLEQILENPAHQPAVSKGDLEALEQEVQQLRDRLKDRLTQAETTVTDAAEQARQQAQEKVDQFLKSLEGQLQPGSELDQAAKQAETQVREQLKQMQDRLSELFSFKAEQEASQEAENGNGTEPSVSDKKGLTPLQMQQWLVDINTQWLITGNVAQTRSQLLAVEQALAISELPNKTVLIRTLGQDLARLEDVQDQGTDQWEPVFQQLTDWVQTAAQNRAPDVSSSDQTSGSQSQAPASEAAAESDWSSQILQGFSQLFEVRKREGDQDLTEVDKLVKADVIQQRGLLLIERMRWAVQTQSEPLLTQALTQMQNYGRTYYPNQADSLEPLLTPLKAVQFQPRQPLNIVAEVQ
jgi:myosin heavy subunit